jgi:hypothetical protein
MPPPRSNTGPRRAPPSPPSPPAPRSPASPPSPPSPDGSRPAPASTSATLSIRVQPDNTTVLIDGERWSGPSSSDEQLIVQVPEGRHHIEVRRDGFETFSLDVDVGAGLQVVIPGGVSDATVTVPNVTFAGAVSVS